MNQALNLLYPDGNQTCLLCHRPLLMQEDEKGGQNPIPGVCPFCLQDAVALYHQETSVRYLKVHCPHLDPNSTSMSNCTSARVLPILAASVYDGLVRNAIRQWKYDGTLEFTKWFAAWMRSAYQDFQAANRTTELAEVAADILTPVPSSLDRFQKRGYDHVLLLAHSLSSQLSIPMQPLLLRRSGPEGQGFTQSQTAKNARERLSGLQGAYTARPGVHLTGKSVLLVDDIVTTGATLYTCTQALYQAGAKHVLAAVIAEVK